jgi:DNA helicase II / ATP-dependent DNA helicase PcrA
MTDPQSSHSRPESHGLSDSPTSESAAVLLSVTTAEEDTLQRVVVHVEERRSLPPELRMGGAFSDYDTQLLALRDELSSARQEDMPPLLEQMERLQLLSDQRRKEQTQGTVDLRSPYFGRLVLRENGRSREVLIGRGTYLDTKSGIRIVDWRDAPVSRLYYRYQEGDEYNETFGGRETDGEVLTRRSLTISDGVLRRIGCPQGVFGKLKGQWRQLDTASTVLGGGEGSAPRPELGRRGSLGIGESALSDEKALREITGLIDRRQFDLITQPDSGLVVIQGGAGSGKTTIGLHRLAYLSYADPRRFRPDRLLVVVFNQALCRYIAQVLPSLGVEGVAIRTYADWANRLRTTHLLGLPTEYSTDTPPVVSRLKKHPLLLRLIDDAVERVAAESYAEMQAAIQRSERPETSPQLSSVWEKIRSRPLRHRAQAVLTFVERQGSTLPTDLRVALSRIAGALDRRALDVVGLWSDVFSDRTLLTHWFTTHAPGEFSLTELGTAHDWCSAHCLRLLGEIEQRREGAYHDRSSRGTRQGESPESSELEGSESEEDDDRSHGVDGTRVDEAAVLDREDDTLLLLLHQRLRGPLLRGSKEREALVYEHILVDEAQDYSPVELSVLLGTVSSGRSITLAGDTAQRVMLDNGFSDWKTVLDSLGLSHVAVEPLCLSYRSTQEIIDLARHVLGPLAPPEPSLAARTGVPVELFQFAHSGDGGGFLAEQLRLLMQAEPRASVAVIARFAEQADAYHEILEKGEVPRLRRIADQDFPFRPGVDVTDVKQVKGLEFDYVVLVEVTADCFPETPEARHLLHIGMTRAAHQLWILVSADPSKLLPQSLVSRAF